MGSEPSADIVLLEKLTPEGITVLTLNRPDKLNAMNEALSIVSTSAATRSRTTRSAAS